MARDTRCTSDPISGLLAVFALVERLKTELHYSWLSHGGQESVAEHCRLMAVMALVVAPHLEHRVDLPRTLMPILVHDIAEIRIGDIPCLGVSQRTSSKAEAEARAVTKIAAMFGDGTGRLISDLWHGFEAGETLEAQFARALDHLEVQLQHTLAPMEAGEPVEFELVHTKMTRPSAHDAMLRRLAGAI